jgi:Spy/CpxP family protein refolding chaperone
MRFLLSLGTCAAALAIVGLAQAQEQKRPREAVAERMQERVQDLDLTDEQEAKIAEVREEHKKTIEACAKDLKSLLAEENDKIQAVLTAEQRTKAGELKDDRKDHRAESLAERIAHLEGLELTGAETAKIAEIREQFRPKRTKSLEALQGLLSDEQKTARAQALEAGKKRREVVASLKLTGDQKERVTAVGGQLRSLLREELSALRDVLSPEQKEEIADFREERRENVRDRRAHAIANAKELDLTAEQKQKISAIRQEYRPKVHEASQKLRSAVREEVQAVVAVLKA